MTGPRLDAVREGVLDEMARGDARFRTTLILAALMESALMAALLLATNWKDPTQRLIAVGALGTWTLTALGLVVLGAYMRRGLAQLAAAVSDAA